jgi:hypothetical protein
MADALDRARKEMEDLKKQPEGESEEAEESEEEGS